MEREERSGMAVQAALDAAEGRCAQVSDCENISIDTDCYASCGALVGSQDKAAIEAAIARVNETTCDGFEQSGCDRFIPPCVPPQSVDCIAGRCESVNEPPQDAGVDSGVGDAGQQGCADQTITWGDDGGLDGLRTTFTLAPCRTFTAEQQTFGNSPMQVCNNQVPMDGEVTVDDIDALVANADVQEAIAAAPVVYGVDSRPVDGVLLRIEIGSAIVDVGSPCEPSSSACTEIPTGVAALQDGLEALFAQQHDVVPTCLNTTE
jgi:hypothetical protein